MLSNFLPQLYYFWIAAKEGNFTRAAKKAFVSQSAISHQIILLENKLNTKLFDREKKGVYLTPQGSQLFQTCESIFKALSKNTEKFFAGDANEPLQISAPPQLGNIIVIDCIKNLINEHPEIKISLHTNTDILKLKSWDADITFNYFPLNKEGFINIPVICSNYVVAGSDSLINKNIAIKKPSDVLKHTLLTINEDLPDWKAFFTGYNLDQRMKNLNRISVGNIDAAISLAAEGFGLIFAPELIIKRSPLYSKLQTIRFDSKTLCHWIFLILRKQPVINPKTTIFLETFKKTVIKFHNSCSTGFADCKKIIKIIDEAIKSKTINTSAILAKCPSLSYSMHISEVEMETQHE